MCTSYSSLLTSPSTSPMHSPNTFLGMLDGVGTEGMEQAVNPMARNVRNTVNEMMIFDFQALRSL